MENTDSAFGEVHEFAQGIGVRYTPGDFLRQVATVIVICLGLAVLAPVLVSLTTDAALIPR